MCIQIIRHAATSPAKVPVVLGCEVCQGCVASATKSIVVVRGRASVFSRLQEPAGNKGASDEVPGPSSQGQPSKSAGFRSRNGHVLVRLEFCRTVIFATVYLNRD